MQIDVIELPRLTRKQHAYVAERIAGKGLSDAYRASYEVSDPNSPGCHRMAWEQETKPKIQAWINHFLNGAGRIQCTREAHLYRLDSLGRKAEGKDKFGDAIKAEELRGKATGHYNHIKQVRTASLDLNEAFEQMSGIPRTLVQNGVKTIDLDDDNHQTGDKPLDIST